MKLIKIRNSMLLLLTSIIWGVAFVFQSKGADVMRPFTFNCIRFFIGGSVLLVLIAAITLLNGKKEKISDNKMWLKGGIFCGIAMFVATNLQQLGIEYTTVGKAGFITAFYIVIVPIISIFFKKKTSLFIWISVALALIGLYFLCINESLSISMGDLLIFLCALAFSVHILIVDRFSPLCDGVKMSCVQFYVCSALSCVFMLVFENDEIPNAINALKGFDAWQALIVTGVFSCGVAYTLQIIGQKNLNPTVASLILSLESVMCALSDWLICGNTMSSREMFGACLMFAAIVLSQLPSGVFKKRTIHN